MAVNAPEAGTIKEFLANEEDTVVVGQGIIRLELGGAPSDGEKKPQEQKSGKEATDTKQEQSQPKEETKPEPKQDNKPSPSPSKPVKDEKPPAKATETESSKTTSSGPNREERRVCIGYKNKRFMY